MMDYAAYRNRSQYDSCPNGPVGTHVSYKASRITKLTERISYNTNIAKFSSGVKYVIVNKKKNRKQKQ